jgi:2-oxoisovalerate dehydrogenase E2 component (dihydrolipoyl transacylase)
VIKLAGEPGDIVPVGAPLVVFETDADVRGPSVGAAFTQAAATKPARETGRIMSSPAVRRMAKEAGIDLATIAGTGPGGRVTRQDFETFAGGPSGPTGGQAVAAEGAPTQAAAAETLKTKEIKVIGLRRIIAERMATATREIPHFTYVEEIDITELEAFRKHLNGKKTDPSQRLTILPFLGLALIRALREFPQCNTTYDKDRNVLLQHSHVHLGVATQTNDGLKVPVVRNADALSIDDLATEIRRLSDAARENKITKEDLSGSTITITSLGKLGGIVSTPVINQPEVSIIGVNRAVERPVVINGQIAVRLMMNLSSSFDHRFVDGYDAAAMIQRIREMLEHPSMIFLPD